MVIGPRFLRAAAATLVILCGLVPASAQIAKKGGGALDKLTMVRPELQVGPRHVSADSAAALKAPAAAAAFRALQAARPEAGWRMTLDAVSGRPALLEGALPWTPGAGNKLTAAAAGVPAGLALKDMPKATMIDKALAFLKANPDLFGLDPDDLRPIDGATGPIGDSAYFVDFQWTWKGIEVEKAHVVFRVNHGNLVQVGQEYVGPAIATLDPTPALSADDAWAAVRSYAGGRKDDRIVAPARLLIVPQADGDGLGYRLIYAVTFVRPGERGTWEGRVDARTGEVVSFRDVDVYGSAHGHAYTHDQPADELDRPFAFVDVGQDGSGATIYADAYGRFSGTSATSALSGKLAKIADNCGAISLSTTSGDLDFGAGKGTDCATPGVGGAGNTHAARTQYYNVNKIKQKALTYLPSNTWLAAQLTINVNVNDTCNAGWSPSTGTLNFFKSGGGCANTGELPGVSLHEFGHGLDTNDGDGFSPDNGTGETYGDFTAALQTHESCLGSGFMQEGVCGGYGDACKTCSGVRDIDYAQHANQIPVTAALLGNATGFHCPSYPSYAGPCGTEGHCESYIGSESLWDLVNRDLPAAGLDVPSAWQLVDRLWYASRPTATANYACTSGTSGFVTDGCGAGSLYTVLRAMDDDDGDLTNGTPHAAAIYAALARHGIACGAATDATNQSHAACAAPGKPTLSGTPGDGQAVLAWTPVAGAQSYRVLRNEDGCSAGFTKIADVAGGSASGYTDGTPLNDLTYYYRVEALGGSESCAGPVSDCATAMPVSRTATLRLDRSFVGCGASRITATLEDADLVGAGRRNVSVFSTVDGTPFGLTLTETGAATGVFRGTFDTLLGSSSQGGAVAIAEGATVTVRYLDAAPSARTVDAQLAVDCSAPTVSNVATSATDESLTVTWTTNEPSPTKLHSSAAAPATDLVVDDGYATSHSATITGLSMCSGYVFDLLLEDRAGNAAVAANGGAHYAARTTGRTFAFADDAERGAGTWTATSASGSPIATSACRAHSGTQSWKFGAASCSTSYASSTDASLVSAPIVLGPSGHGMRLRFWQWVQTESGYDYSYVQISSDGGKTWTNLVQPFAGESDGWIRWTIDLAAYTGTVQLRFRFKSDSSVNYEGWYVDDVDVSAPSACAAVPRRAGTTILDACHGTGTAPDGVADPGEHLRLPMSFFNAGGAPATGLTATLATTDARATVTNGSTTVPDIAGGATVETAYPPFAVKVGGGAGCGAQIPLTLKLAGAEGSWTEPYALQIGQNIVSGSAKALDEHFDYPTGAASTWMPTGWAVTHTGSQANWLVLMSSTRSDCTSDGKSSATHSGGAYAADAWLFSTALSLKAGTTYALSFNLKAVTGTVKLDVALGSAQTAASMTTTLWTTSSFAGSTCTAETASFTVPSDGTYYIGFHDKTAASSGTVGVDDVVLAYPTYNCVIHACSATPLPVPGETAAASGAALLWSGSTKDTLTWGANADAANGYRLYEGAAADLTHADGAQANACVRWSGTATTTGPVLTAAPAGGQVQWFLVSGVNDAGEGPAAAGWKITSSGACR